MSKHKARRFSPLVLFTVLAISLIRPNRLTAEPALDDLVHQLSGKSCRFKPKSTYLDSANCEEQSLADRVLSTLDKPGRCECVGHAAACIGAMKEGGKAALPDLINALKNGPTDFNTGDGTMRCLSLVLEALGAIGDERAIPALIEYLRAPRGYSYYSGWWSATKESSNAIGIGEAAQALATFGPHAESAVPVLENLLKMKEHQTVQIWILLAIAKISPQRAINPLMLKVAHLKEIVTRPVERTAPWYYLVPSTVIEDLHEIEAAADGLGIIQKSGVSIAAAQSTIRDTLSSFDNIIPQWIKEQFTDYHFSGNEEFRVSELKRLNHHLESVRRKLSTLLKE